MPHDIRQTIARMIRKSGSIILTTHVNPDGDGLGSEVALYYACKQMNKKIRIINTSDTPRQYQFLNKGGIFQTYQPKKHDRALHQCDLILVVDISVSKRLDRMQAAVMQSPALKICIDHHLDNDGFAHYTWADETAPATCEMVYHFLNKNLKVPLDLTIARALYTGLITDTGNFRFNSTKPETFEIGAELLRFGIQPNEIYSHVFEQGSLNTLKLLGLLLERMTSECNGAFNWTYLSQEDFQNTSTQTSDTEGYVDYTLKLAGAQMGVLFYETPEGDTKVSLRAKGKVNVQRFAVQHGGGGHFSAAGILIKEPFMPTVKTLVRELREYYNRNYAK